jgi:RND family efflux transporter MFP subunit
MENRMSPKSQGSALSRKRLGLAGIGIAAIFLVVLVAGIATRKIADAHLREWTEKQAVPNVTVITADTRGRRSTVDLPGRLEAYSQAQLFARVSGYVKDWKADIGTPVKAGQLLAEIDAPDLDQQIMQAEADVTTAKANLELAVATLDRGRSLITTGAVSQQSLDQRAADAAGRQGLLKSSQANLDRLRVLEKYKRITAPFDGLVTARTTDVGALINAGAGGGPALFVVSDITKLRAYVNVPQNYVPEIPIGTKAQISVPEYPGRTFPAVVEASARSVEAGSGTTRMLLVVDNPKGEMMTGAYASVSLELAHPQISIIIPASALLFDQSGLRVATLGLGNKVELKKVTISRDMGREVDIGSGLTADDRIIASPPDGLSTGDEVAIAGAPPATASDKPVTTKPRG